MTALKQFECFVHSIKVFDFHNGGCLLTIYNLPTIEAPNSAIGARDRSKNNVGSLKADTP
jgi:hypothetical protein